MLRTKEGLLKIIQIFINQGLRCIKFLSVLLISGKFTFYHLLSSTVRIMVIIIDKLNEVCNFYRLTDLNDKLEYLT